MRRILLIVATVASLASAAASQATAELPAAETKKLREMLAAALAAPREKAAKDLLAAAKEWEAKYSRASLLAALRAGPLLPADEPKPRGTGKKAEKLTRFPNETGVAVVGYTFESGGASYRYAVDIPKGYDGKRLVPLLVDPGHGSGKDKDDAGKADFMPFFRGQARNAGLDDCLVARTEIIEQIGADGARGAKPEDEIVAVFGDFFRDVASRFAVDPDRIFVSGLSQTGFWAWCLGAARADRLAGIAPMSAVTWQVNGRFENFGNLPVFVLHGDADKICPVEQPRKTVKELEARGVGVKYEEVAGAGHDVNVSSRLGDGLRWLAEKPRQLHPKKVAKSVQTLADPWCYWLRLDAIEKSGTGKAGQPPTAKVAAEIDGQSIKITSEGVQKLTLVLSSELLDLAKPVQVEWHSKNVMQGVAKPSFVRCVEIALERADWHLLGEATVELSR